MQQKQFRLLWAGQAISALGDAFAFVAVPLLVLDATGSVVSMGLVSATGVAAQVATSLVSGAIVDRVDRRRLMILCDLGRTLAYGLVPLCWSLGFHSLPLIFLMTAVAGALGNLFGVANIAALPDIVQRDRLHEANGRLALSQALAYVLGPLLAGVVAAHSGPVAALTIDAATFLVSAASLIFLSFGRGHLAGATRTDRAPTAGVRYLFRHPAMRALMILVVLLGLTSNVGLSAGIVDLLVFHLKRELGAGDRAVGLVLGTAAVGAVLGAGLAPRIRRRFGFGPCFLGGTFLQALGLLSMGAIRAAGFAAFGAFLWAGGLMLRAIASQAFRQEATPPEMLGRAAAAYLTLALSASAVGTALVTRLGSRWGAAHAMTGIGVSVVLIVLLGMLTPAAEREPNGS